MRLTRIVMPEAARPGDVVQIRTLINHPMVTGHSAAGSNTLPRDIIHTFSVTYDGGEIFRADFMPGIAANPYVAFHVVATRTGPVVFTWTGDTGEVTTVTRTLHVA